MIEIVSFVVVFIFCTFLLYMFSKHDFVLLRQNISLAQIFDNGAVAALLAFLIGRLFFTINNFSTELLNVFRFFHILRFPGFSGLGFFIGGAIGLYFLFRKRKSLERIYDIFTISFMPLYALGFILRPYPGGLFYVPIILAIIFVFLFAFFVRSHNKYLLKDGSISFIFLSLISLDAIFYQFLNAERFVFFEALSFLQIVGIPLASVALVFFLSKQKILKH